MKKRNAIILLLLAGILAFRCDPEGPDTSLKAMTNAIPFYLPDSLIFTPVSGSISARVLSFLT
jgi:hypothetical protein